MLDLSGPPPAAAAPPADAEAGNGVGTARRILVSHAVSFCYESLLLESVIGSES